MADPSSSAYTDNTALSSYISNFISQHSGSSLLYASYQSPWNHYNSSVYKKGKSNSAYYYYCNLIFLLGQSIPANRSRIVFQQIMFRNVSGNTLMWNSVSGPKAILYLRNHVNSSSEYSYNVGSAIPRFPLEGKVAKDPQVTHSWETNVNHNDNGTLVLDVYSKWDADESATSTNKYYPVDFNLPVDQVTLPTIPRASELSALTNLTIANKTGYIGGTITAKADFYHILKYKLASEANYTEAFRGQLATGTHSFSSSWIPYTSILAKMPNDKTATLNVLLETYSDNGYTSLTGSAIQNGTVAIDVSQAIFKPTIVLSNQRINTSVLGLILADGNTKMQAHYQTTKDSTAGSVTTYFAIEGNGAISTACTTATSGDIITDYLPAKSQNYTFRIRANAVDSRGIDSGYVYGETVTVLGYNKPSITPLYYRVAANQSSVKDMAGDWAYINILYSLGDNSSYDGANYISANDPRHIKTYSIYEADPVTGNRTLVTSGTLNFGENWIQLAKDRDLDFSIRIYDQVSYAEVNLNVAKAIITFEVVDEDRTGQNIGMAFFGSAEANKVKFGKPVHVKSGNVYLPVYASEFHGDLVGNADTATLADEATNATNAANADTAAKLGSSSKGGSNTPIYLNNGSPEVGNEYVPKTGGAYSGNVTSTGSIVGARDILWEGTTQGGNNINLDVSAYKQIRVWFHMYAITFPVDVDLDKVPLNDVSTSYPDWYSSSNSGSYYANRAETYYGVVLVNPAKTIVRIHYIAFYYGTSYNARNNNASYFAYRIEGLRR